MMILIAPGGWEMYILLSARCGARLGGRMPGGTGTSRGDNKTPDKGSCYCRIPSTHAEQGLDEVIEALSKARDARGYLSMVVERSQRCSVCQCVCVCVFLW